MSSTKLNKRRGGQRLAAPSIEPLERRELLSTYYVSTSGSDSAAGSSAAPWRTLAKAAGSVAAGDTVLVRPGTYTGFNLTTDGTASQRIVFAAETPGTVVVDRGPHWSYAINLEGASYVTIEGFRVEIPDAVQANTGIRSVTNAGVVIRNNTIKNANWWGILTGFSENVLIENNDVSVTRNEHGIYVGNSADGPVIRGNTVYSNRKSGIQINGDAEAGGDGVISNALVEDNVVYNNGLGPGGSGLNFDSVQNSVFRNNLLYDNHRSGISLYSSYGNPSSGNLVANNTVVMRTDGGGFWPLNIRNASTGNTALNNVFYHYGSRGSIDIAPDSLGGFVSDYNALVNKFSIGDDNYAPGLTLSQWRSQTGQDAHSFTATAAELFVNAAAKDFRLRAGSPAIDAGNGSLSGKAAPAADLTGASRPQGGGWDVGAYELSAAPDTTAPVISGTASSNITSLRATITWSTNEAADTQVEYGTSTSYGSSSPLSSLLDLAHSVTLTGLTPNTVYHYRVKSRDALGNLTVSGDLTFTTAAPDTTAPTISGIASGQLWPGGAAITWSTNEPASSQVEYGTTTSYGSSTVLSPTLVGSHSVAISGLSASTTYHYRVRSADETGNLRVSGDLTFTTTAAGQIPAGALAFWQFGESSGTSAADASGNNRTGTLVNGPAFVAGRSGAGNALSFDGSNDSVRVTRVAALEPGKVSLSAWVRLNGTQADWGVIVKKTYDNDNSEPYGSYSLQVSAEGLTNHLGFVTGHEGAGHTLLSSAALPTNQWVHVAGTYDPATGQKVLYVNGVAAATATAFSNDLVYDTSTAGDLYLGQDPGSGEAFRGLIDDVGVWGRALTAAEVAGLAYAGASSDTTAPVIGNVASSNATATGVSINWSTDEAADTQVEYGTTAGYGSSSTLNAAMVSNHAVTLSGLSPATTYHYRVRSRDAAGNLAVSGDFTVTTAAAPDITPPTIGSVGTSGISTGGATIIWTTNEASDTQVQYGTTTAYGSSSPLNSAMVTSHSVSFSGLAAETTYHFRVLSRDAAGNLATSADFTFKTAAVADTAAPTATGSFSNVTAGGAANYTFTVTYSDNVAVNASTFDGSDVRVTGPNGFNQAATFISVNTSGNGSPRTVTYRINTPGGSWNSADNGTYSVALQSGQVADTAGNAAAAGTLGTFTVSVPAPDTTPPIISSAASSGISTSGATITWTTNEASDTQVQYGTTTAYGSSSALNSAMVTSHSVSLSGLAAGTTYHFRVLSRDAAGNLATSANFAFTTATIPDTAAPTAVGSLTGVTAAGGTAYSFSVTYADNIAVAVSSLGSGDLLVTGPNGFSAVAELVSAGAGNGTPRTATYRITPPGGTWDDADNGTYTITLQAGEVLDTSGNAAAGGALGTFEVSVSPSSTPTAVLSPAGVLTVSGTAGDDSISVGAMGSLMMVVVNGASSSFTLSAVNNILVQGMSGNDTIALDDASTVPSTVFGDLGDDSITGGSGRDMLHGGSGRDLLYGGEGVDELIGSTGDDVLLGEGGNDLLKGGDGRDSALGGSGNDRALGQMGPDTLRGGTGSDRLIGGSGHDRVFGDSGNDKLVDGEGTGDDMLSGGEDNDKLIGAAGVDRLFGDGGNDFIFSRDGRIEFVDGGDGIDRVDLDPEESGRAIERLLS